MARCGSYLLLQVLLVVISQCESAEYFIRPTALGNSTSCPGQPCLTLNQYMKNTSYYVQSNTVLNFLPGEHVLERPLQIRNVENVTLQSSTAERGMYSQLLVQFYCENASLNHCIYTPSAIKLIDAVNVSINGISLEMWTPNVSGVIVNRSINVHLQLRVQGNNYSHAVGVAANDSHLYMNGVRADSLSNGIMIENTNKVNITHSSFDDNQNSGIVIIESDAVEISNTTLSGNKKGMDLEHCCNVTLTSISATNNWNDGIHLILCSNVSLEDISATNNGQDGVDLISCSDVILKDVSAINNEGQGIYMRSAINNGRSVGSCENTKAMNIYTINQFNGILILGCKNTTMINIYAINRYCGISIGFSENTTIMNTYLSNQFIGMDMMDCNNTTMINISIINNEHGMELNRCKNTTMMNMSVLNNPTAGIGFLKCEDTTMISISAINNHTYGMYFWSCKNTILAFVNAAYNQNGGILIERHFGNALLRNISVNHNGKTQIKFLSSENNIQLEDSIFSDIVALPTFGIDTEPRTIPAVIELNNSTLIMSNCIFTRNNITSTRAIDSKIIVKGKIIFSENQALTGAALLFANSVLAISETSSVIFKNNHAINYGGAIYIITDDIYDRSVSIEDVYDFSIPSSFALRTRCFLSVEGDRSQARLFFTNNMAGKGGDVVYGGLVALGYDGDWNCLLSFKNISDISQQNGFSVISSEPSRVCLCRNGQPDCLTVADPVTRNIYPGQTITLPAVVVGQDFGTVTGSVIAQILQTDATCSIVVKEEQRSTAVDNDQCADLNYTLYTSGGENCTAILTLTTNNAQVLQHMNTDDNYKLNNSWAILNYEPNYNKLAYQLMNETLTPFHEIVYNYSEVFINNFLKFSSEDCNYIFDYSTLHRCLNVDSNLLKFVFPKEVYNYPTFINISFQSCPLGFALSRNPPFKCDCNHLLQQMPQVTCDIQYQTITRDGLVWVGTYDDETVAASKYCPYNYCKSIRTEINLTASESDSEYVTTDFQCNQQHSGVLCGGCKPGLSLALGTNQCLRCSNIYISLLLPFALAGLLLVFVIKIFDLTISQGTLNELIFYANVVSANKHLYYNQSSVNPTTLFIAWFNLDIGIETCFFNGLTAYSRTWLQFVFPLYIWAIAGGIIIVAKHSDRVAKVMGNNGVPVLATLFLLSYAKLFNTIITAMSYTTLYTSQGEKLVWSADGNLDYLGSKHIPLFCVAIAGLIFLWIPYTLLLLLGQWLHRLNCHVITCILLKMKPFLDAHFAAFKDKYRYWFGLLLLVRAANLVISASIPDESGGIVEFSIALLSILLSFGSQRVYRSSAVGIFGTVFLLNLAIMNVTKLFSNNSNGNVATVLFILIAIALAQFLGLILYKVVKILKSSRKLTVCCVREHEPIDEWELYEEAALIREQAALEGEKKSDTDSEVDQESNSGSIESIPTY